MCHLQLPHFEAMVKRQQEVFAEVFAKLQAGDVTAFASLPTPQEPKRRAGNTVTMAYRCVLTADSSCHRIPVWSDW